MKIEVTFPPGEVNVDFIHYWSHSDTSPGSVPDTSTRAIVTWRGIVYRGIAYLHPKDRPSRAIGRKVALKRAMLKAGLNREWRTEIWHGLQAKGMKME